MSTLTKLITVIILFLVTTPLYAYAVTRTFTSVPINSGFYYSNQTGTIFSSGVTQHVPVVITQTPFPNGIWVMMYNGHVPNNALVMHYVNGRPIFYCRAITNNGVIYYGGLIAGEGCYLQDVADNPITTYQVLLR